MNLKRNSRHVRQNATASGVPLSGDELEGSLGEMSRRSVGLHSHHPLVVWTRSELVALVEKLANQNRRITAAWGRYERAIIETAVCPVPLAVPDKEWSSLAREISGGCQLVRRDSGQG